jgi:acyl-CoA synthetase (NDP forming)
MRTALLVLLISAPAFAGDCPKPVTEAIAKAYPKASVKACKAEGANFEARLANPDVELDLAADGKILATEEKIAVDTLPDAVKKAFAAKYPKAKAERAEKETTADKKVSYEIKFGKTEATFAADGTFIEEE